MGAHSVPKGEYSTSGAPNGSPSRGGANYEGRHRAEAGSELPARGKGVTADNTKPTKK